jgi:hypothetical protein
LKSEAYPPWRAALEKFAEAGFEPGEIIPHEWFYEAFEVTKPGPEHSYPQGEKLKMQCMAQMAEFRVALEEEQKVYLKSVMSKGYQWVPPSLQTETGYQQGRREMRNAMKKMASTVLNVDVTKLTMEQRVENSKTLAKIQHMADMIRPPRPQLLRDIEE